MILLELVMGTFSLETLANSQPEKLDSLRGRMINGLAVGALMVLRLVVRSMTQRPAPMSTGLTWTNKLGPRVHLAIYVVVFLMVASGLALAVQAGLTSILSGESAQPLPNTFDGFWVRAVHAIAAKLIDTGKIAAAGHSYGANTAMLVAGARVNAGSAYAGELGDKRFQAAILISAPPLLGQGPAQEVFGRVSVPTLHITSLEDTINLPGYRSTVEDRIIIFEAMAQSPRTLAVYKTGGHSIFTDRTTRSGPETSARIKGATQELCTIFLRQSLDLRHSPVNTEGMMTNSEVTSKRAETTDAHEAQQGASDWAYRHRDLLVRFTSRER